MLLKNHTLENKYSDSSITLNFGPQHPSAHGVLRLLLQLDGEYIKRADVHIGLLHRGTEKLIEHKTYIQAIPYFCRLDYVGTMAQEHAFVLSVESLVNKSVVARAQTIRVLFDEISRLLNHLLSITAQALDIGAITPFLIGFEEREKLMELYEAVSGARLHTAYLRVGGVGKDLPDYFIELARSFVQQFPERLLELQRLLGEGGIWTERLENTGIISQEDAMSFSCTGVVLRSTGVAYDLRRISPYSSYKKYNFMIPLGKVGDNYSRYCLRLLEMFESIRIMKQALAFLENDSKEDAPLNVHGFFNFNISKNSKINEKNHVNLHTNRTELKYNMENLIDHFGEVASFGEVPFGKMFRSLEAPKGELGVFLCSDGGTTPTRCRIRTPGFFHLQILDLMSKNCLLADVVANIGSLDLVFGEIDR